VSIPADNRLVPLSQSLIDELFDFDDPAGSEDRLRAAALSVVGDESAELETLVARTLGLRDRFAEGHALLDSIDEVESVVLARVELERGRLLRSSGDLAASIPHFESAIEHAVTADHDFLRVDAMHMLALVDPTRANDVVSAALMITSATTDSRTKRWAVSLHNNLGWALHDAGNYSAALAEFRLALEAAETFGTEEQVTWANEAIAECLSSLTD
jgi:tetratricopeptide (TPR) repeat protein